MQKIIILSAFVLSSVWVFSFSENEISTFHSSEEKDHLKQLLRNYSYQTNNLFTGSGLCLQCHGYDDNQVASVDAMGNDVNVMDDWAATMMANSARDPLWRAKVSHEILVNPALQTDIEQKCTECHAPMGNYNAAHLGQPYSIAALTTDSLGLDGVSCGACHQIRDTLLGKKFSGNLHYDTNHVIYGPYQNPFVGPMYSNIGYTPVYSPHINNSALCGNCHTLQTETVDLTGNLTGDVFTEQATYHEWLNSNFNTNVNPSGISCQGCHLPQINDAVILSANPPIIPGRSPFGLHHLVGANSFMLKLIKTNAATLNIYATSQQFDSTIARTNKMLREKTLDLNLMEVNRTVDTVFYNLTLTNKAGHKFPSGYPSRLAYVEFIVYDANGDTLFKSGLLDNQSNIINRDPTYEPHFDLINSEQQVQIYEMVMGDVNNNATTVLTRAKSPLKDNRLVPEGFVSTHFAYDTCKVAGGALLDNDFNKNLGVEGTGKDILHYHIPLNGYSGTLSVSARVYYQSVPRKWLDEMFSFSSTEIDLFQTLYNAADHSPVLVNEALQGPLFQSIKEQLEQLVQIFPNPVTQSQFFIKNESRTAINAISIFDLQGKKVASYANGNFSQSIPTPITSGTYIIRIEMDKATLHKKLIVVR